MTNIPDVTLERSLMRPGVFGLLFFSVIAVSTLLIPVPGDYVPTVGKSPILDSFPPCWRILEDRADFLRRSGTLIHLGREPLGYWDDWLATGHEFSLGGWRPAAGDSFDLAEFYDGARARFPRSADTATGRLYWPGYPNLATAMSWQGARIRGVAVECPPETARAVLPRSG